MKCTAQHGQRLAQHNTTQGRAGQGRAGQGRLTSSMSGSFQAPGPANLDKPIVLSRHRKILSHEAAMSAVVLQELATYARSTALQAVMLHPRQSLSRGQPHNVCNMSLYTTPASSQNQAA